MMYRLDLSTIPQLTPLRGDYDADGDVDGADLLGWQRALGLAVAQFSGADGDGSGIVDDGDLSVWKKRYGDDARSPGDTAALTTVPEPKIMTLLASAAVALTSMRRLRLLT